MIKTWRYSIPSEKHQGWAILFLDNAGCFAALSDWGDYTYRWNMNGIPDGKFREFLLKVDKGYLISKIGGEQKYCGEKTYKGIKEHILQYRRIGHYNQEEARYEWNLLEDFDNLEYSEDFANWLDNTEISDAWEMACYDYSYHANKFIENCWPKLKELIKQKLQQEQENLDKIEAGIYS